MMKRLQKHPLIITLLLSACGLIIPHSLAWAQADEPQTEQPQETSEPVDALPAASFSTQNKPELLAKELQAEQVTWLSVGEQPVLALYNAEISGDARGGVIVLPRHEHSIGTLTLLNNLQQTLVDNNWHALTVSMPPVKEAAKVKNTPPKKDIATQQEGDTTASEIEATPAPAIEENSATSTKKMETPIDYEKLAQQHIEAAVLFLNRKGIFNIVILGEGSGANRAISYINNITDPERKKQIRGLAMINAYNSIEGSANNITELVPKLQIPTLDIYFDDSNRFPADAKKRQRSSSSLPRGRYQQLKMPRMLSGWNDKEDRLSKRIRGWLDRSAAGFTIGI